MTSAQGPRRAAAGAHAFALATLLFAACLQLFGLPRVSPTVDEPSHLVSGLAVWAEGDTRLNWFHPPLGNALIALPALTLPGARTLSAMEQWDDARIWQLGMAYAQWDYPRFRAQLGRARLATIVLTLLLGCYVYLWCLGQLGARAALCALVLVLFNPTVLAHGRLVTADLVTTLAFVIAVGEFVRYLQRSGWSSVVLLGVVTGAACATKWSAVALVPVFLGFGIALAWNGTYRFAGLRSRAVRLGILCREVALVTAVVLLTINAAYGFQRTFWSVDRILAHPESVQGAALPYQGQMLETVTPLPRLPGWLPIPLPYTYVFGMGQIVAHNAQKQDGWFMGKPRDSGTPLYFPTLIAFKTPVPLLAIGLSSLLAWAVSRRRLPLALAVAAVAGIVFLAMAMYSNINIGVRHVLPVVVLLAMVSGFALARWWSAPPVKVSAKTRTVVAVALLGASVVSTVASAPHFLGFFNVLAGGRAGGHRISVVAEDWGQDVADLAAGLRDGRFAPLAYHPYYPTQATELAYHGTGFISIRCNPLRSVIHGRWIAIHATLLARFPDCYRWLRARQPDAHINHHILLFDNRDGRLDAAPDQGDGETIKARSASVP